MGGVLRRLFSIGAVGVGAAVAAAVGTVAAFLWCEEGFTVDVISCDSGPMLTLRTSITALGVGTSEVRRLTCVRGM